MKIISIALVLIVLSSSATSADEVAQRDARTCAEYLEVVGEKPNDFKEQFWEYVCSHGADKA